MKRLTHEASASLGERKNEARKQVKAVGIDPVRHPELAKDEFRVRVSQLKLLSPTGGIDTLEGQIDAGHADAEPTRQPLPVWGDQPKMLT